MENSLIKQTFTSILQAKGEKFYWDCQMGKYELPGTPKGRQTKTFKINQRVGASGKGSQKAGTIGVIKSMYKENGFWYHVVAWSDNYESIERQSDIVAL